jgi:hypothetical protein
MPVCPVSLFDARRQIKFLAQPAAKSLELAQRLSREAAR